MPDPAPEAEPSTVGPPREAAARHPRSSARQPLPIIPEHAEQVFQLWPDEVIHAERRTALLHRGQDLPPSAGALYLTSRRLVHVGSEAVEEIELERISHIAVAQDRRLVVELSGTSDLVIELNAPRLLRAQVDAARATLRDRHA